ncbi:MAG: DNA replication and repair protein RecF [Halieaceae bacterium]
MRWLELSGIVQLRSPGLLNPPFLDNVALSQLNIHSVRNLREVKVRDLGRVNVFYGPNGSGKTSVLESIHLLGMARSFRGTSAKTLITHGAESCTVFGSISSGPHHSGISVGVQRKLSGEAQIKVADTVIRTVAELIQYLPVLVINSGTFDLLMGPPRARRQYLDWGVFHVEPTFFSQWQRFQRCIKQRNSLLRRDKISIIELSGWTRDLIVSGTAINEFRQGYFRLLAPSFKSFLSALMPELQNIELHYRQGWDKNIDYESALANSYDADHDRGYTHVGPQRADMRVTIDGHSAADTLSRGQQKLLVCALKLAQGQLMGEKATSNCVYLVDDLPSELDKRHSRLVAEKLESLGVQVFITSVEREDIESVWPKPGELTMFHVEHGAVEKVPALTVEC